MAVRERLGEGEEGSVPATLPGRVAGLSRTRSPGGNEQPPRAPRSGGSRGGSVRAPAPSICLTSEPPPRLHPQPRPARPTAAAAAAPTCAAAGTVRDGSRSLPATKRRARRAELVGRLRLPGRGQAEHAAGAVAGAPSSRRARGPAPPAARPPLPGTASQSLPRGGSAGSRPPPGPPALRPRPLGRGAAGGGNEVPAESPPGRAQFPGLSLRGR